MIELAKKFGTPVYILNETKIRDSCRKFKYALEKKFGSASMVLYASKALCCGALYRIINSEKLGIDVVSEGELFTAIVSGFPMEKIHFHGNNKSVSELIMGIEHNVGRIVVDNFEELKKLIFLSKDYKKKVNILLRIRPGVEVNTHDSVKTGNSNSKFGFSLNETETVVSMVLASNFLNFKGFHSHIGSQIFEIKSFVDSAKILIDLCYFTKKKFNFEVEEINLGGGFGIKYVEQDRNFDLQRYMTEISEVIKSKCKEFDMKVPFIYIEPGRSIVGEAGTTLYTVGCIKKMFNEKIYVIVDGSMADNPRFALYGSKYFVENITKKDKNCEYDNVTISGKCCESGDIIAEDVSIKEPSVGDILAVHCTGAYNFSMASNYNKLCRPPIVLVKEDGSQELIVKRQKLEDLIL
ncbi:MAG: diaminopimelate decarboxylase [Firmicutes bacterium]|nr:diaminopimelate decarboxylase [Bacillota bacterium]